MYVIKTKGTCQIPDFIQVRDENFILVDHYKVADIESLRRSEKFALPKEHLNYIKNSLPYGVLYKIELS